MQFKILLMTSSKKKNCSKVMNKPFNKELVMTKENNEDFMNSTFAIKLDNRETLRIEIVIS